MCMCMCMCVCVCVRVCVRACGFQVANIIWNLLLRFEAQAVAEDVRILFITFPHPHTRKYTRMLTFEIWGTGSSWRRPQTLFPWHGFWKVSTLVHFLYKSHYIEDFWDVRMLVAQCRPHRPRLIPPPPSLFLSGRLSVLRALLRVRALFNRGDRYILNSLYIEDYLCWLQVKYLSFLCFIIL
jgi:hypothetical protein